MEEVRKETFLRKLNKSKKIQVVFFVVSMIVVITVYLVIMWFFGRRFSVVEDDFSWVYQIDQVEESENDLVLSGWAFQLGKTAEQKVFDVILYDTETGKGYFPKMKYEAREDVNEYFLCEYDYTQCGFTAAISLGKLDLEHKVYEILIRPEKGQRAFATGVYYADGKMLFSDPKEFVALETEGTDLEKITEEGILRVYRPDYGMYVYQYEGELYWIAEEYYGFVDGDTYVQFQMGTTQIDKLPEERLKNNWFWSNIGFYFKSNELLEWDSGRYRITKCSLPTEYSLTDIVTGNYIDGWIWQQYFRPWYEFD